MCTRKKDGKNSQKPISAEMKKKMVEIAQYVVGDAYIDEFMRGIIRL